MSQALGLISFLLLAQFVVLFFIIEPSEERMLTILLSGYAAVIGFFLIPIAILIGG